MDETTETETVVEVPTHAVIQLFRGHQSEVQRGSKEDCEKLAACNPSMWSVLDLNPALREPAPEGLDETHDEGLKEDSDLPPGLPPSE